jgi:hypothetical protein
MLHRELWRPLASHSQHRSQRYGLVAHGSRGAVPLGRLSSRADAELAATRTYFGRCCRMARIIVATSLGSPAAIAFTSARSNRRGSAVSTTSVTAKPWGSFTVCGPPRKLPECCSGITGHRANQTNRGGDSFLSKPRHVPTPKESSGQEPDLPQRPLDQRGLRETRFELAQREFGKVGAPSVEISQDQLISPSYSSH